ncbi:MAG: hypothetical protein IJ756_06950 [Paludibacteraceae bacterium]|nr:hypothetical protein [Paludibacteraceae bacterium]
MIVLFTPKAYPTHAELAPPTDHPLIQATPPTKPQPTGIQNSINASATFG